MAKLGAKQVVSYLADISYLHEHNSYTHRLREACGTATSVMRFSGEKKKLTNPQYQVKQT